MPIHDWTRVEAGIFHDFHHAWIEEIKRFLNRDLPPDFYALAEQFAGGFGPDVLTPQARHSESQEPDHSWESPDSGGGVLLAPPKTQLMGQTEFYRHKQKRVVVRHVSDDRVVAVVEIVSPGNKSSRAAVRAFLDKALELLRGGVHLLLVDLLPPTPRDPDGLHALIWSNVANIDPADHADKPLNLVSYEVGHSLRYFQEPVAVGDSLPDMPLFLEPNAHINVDLNSTYTTAFEAVPRRWRGELE